MLVSFHHKQCVPIECKTRVGPYCPGDTCCITEFWIYDKQGKLLTDSINDRDTIRSLTRTFHFSYQGDSTICAGSMLTVQNKDTMVSVADKNRVPFINAFLPAKWGDFFQAYYNADGTMHEIKSTRVNGRGETWHTTIDSIIYAEGNIVAYRSRMNNIGDSGTTYFTYYSDKPFKQFFNPVDRILPLTHGLSRCQGVFNVQFFSKNLLKTQVNQGEVRASYEYKLDDEGKVIQMKVNYPHYDPNYDPSHFTTYVIYDFKYSCQ
jgi:hypothetical protein